MVDPLKKARDADRDAAIEVVEAAYADGQITQPDYEIRVDRLLKAQTVGEVQQQVHDLRRDPEEEVTDVVEAVTGETVRPPPTPPTARIRRPRSTSGATPRLGLVTSVVIGVIVLGAALAVALPLWLTTRSTEGVATGPVGLGERVDLHTPEGYQLFAEALEEKTGGREAFRLVLYPDYAVVDVPVDRSSQRSHGWYFDGDWSEFGGKGTSTEERFSVDQVDGSVVAQGIQLARDNVDEPSAWYVIIEAPDTDFGDTCLTAYASNDYQESFFVRLTCDGTVVQ